MAILGRDRRAIHGEYYYVPILTPHDILDHHFDVKKYKAGYDPDEVDDYLDAVAAALAGLAPRLTALDIREHEFQLTRKFGSYDFGEVDDFLEIIAQTLEVIEAEYSELPPPGDSPPPPPPPQWGGWGG